MLLSIGFNLKDNYSVLISFEDDKKQPFIAYVRTDVEVARLIATLNQLPEKINIIFEGNLGTRRERLIDAIRNAITSESDEE